MLTRTQTPPPVSKTVPLAVGRYSVLGRAGIGVSDAYRAPAPDGKLVAVLRSGLAGSPADYAGAKPVPFAEAVFSLGALIHEALTGSPWAPDRAADARRRRPAARPTGLTERTERAIRRATHPDPAKRPA